MQNLWIWICIGHPSSEVWRLLLRLLSNPVFPKIKKLDAKKIGYQHPQVYLHGTRYPILTRQKSPLVLLTTFDHIIIFYNKYYVSANVSLYFSHALSLQSMRTGEAHSTEQRLYHFIQHWGYSATSVYSAVDSFSAIGFVFWQTVSTLLDNKSMQVITPDRLPRIQRKCIRLEVKVQSLSWLELLLEMREDFRK